MVKEESAVYLLIGQDSPDKNARLKQLRGELLSGAREEFNLDVIYAKDATVRILQERLKALPVDAEKRIVVIRQADDLKKEIREFLLGYIEKPYREVVLVLDLHSLPAEGDFAQRLLRRSRVYRFKEAPAAADAFSLGRYIAQGKADCALQVLNQLLESGEKPERILGGLRYMCQKDIAFSARKKIVLGFILECDLEIKTGRLRPDFALEKLVVGLTQNLSSKQLQAGLFS